MLALQRLAARDFVVVAGFPLLSAAGGEEGNPLDDRFDSRGTSGAAQLRRGISDRLTVEAGHQYDGRVGSSLAIHSARLRPKMPGLVSWSSSWTISKRDDWNIRIGLCMLMLLSLSPFDYRRPSRKGSRWMLRPSAEVRMAVGMYCTPA